MGAVTAVVRATGIKEHTREFCLTKAEMSKKGAHKRNQDKETRPREMGVSRHKR